MEVSFKFCIGDIVRIDGCPDTKAVVVQARIGQNDSVSYSVEWMNGGMHSAVIEEWRISYP